MERRTIVVSFVMVVLLVVIAIFALITKPQTTIDLKVNAGPPCQNMQPGMVQAGMEYVVRVLSYISPKNVYNYIGFVPQFIHNVFDHDYIEVDTGKCRLSMGYWVDPTSGLQTINIHDVAASICAQKFRKCMNEYNSEDKCAKVCAAGILEDGELRGRPYLEGQLSPVQAQIFQTVLLRGRRTERQTSDGTKSLSIVLDLKNAFGSHRTFSGVKCSINRGGRTVDYRGNPQGYNCQKFAWTFVNNPDEILRLLGHTSVFSTT